MGKPITYHESYEIERIFGLFRKGDPVRCTFGDFAGRSGVVTEIEGDNGDPGTFHVSFRLDEDGKSCAGERVGYYPYSGGIWWLLPEEEFERWTRRRKGAGDCEGEAAEDTTAADRYRLLDNIQPGSVLVALSNPRECFDGSHCQLPVGLPVVVKDVLDRDVDRNGRVRNARVTIWTPFAQRGNSANRSTGGVWLFNPDEMTWRLKPVADDTDTNDECDAENGTQEGQSEMSSNPNPETVPEVVRSGKAIALPEGMSMKKAIQTLERRMKYEEEETQIREEITTFPWDGAHALSLALARRYGWATAEPIPGFFGPTPPSLIAVDVAPGKTINVPWGRFSIPGIEGFIQTGSVMKDGRPIFVLVAVVKRRHEDEIKALADTVRKIARDESIYRGKAIKVAFGDATRPDEFPMPKFLDVSKATEDRLVFAADVENAVRDNLYTPIERYSELARLGVPFKRGVILAGTYGTGKTELAFTAANKAAATGITFVYCEDAKDFPKAIQFALQYAPAVVFTEDIDRVTSGERTRELDAVLNTIDGIEAKASEVFVVLTTNAVENINRAMIRPGRIDAVIEVKRPDARAVDGLIRLYARDLLPVGEDVAVAAGLLKGQIPAVIREVVERAKLSALRLAPRGSKDVRLSGAALASSAETMRMQLALLNRQEEPNPSELEKLGHVIGNYIAESAEMARRVRSGELKDEDGDEVGAEVTDEEFNRALSDMQKKRDLAAVPRPQRRGGRK